MAIIEARNVRSEKIDVAAIGLTVPVPDEFRGLHQDFPGIHNNIAAARHYLAKLVGSGLVELPNQQKN